MTTVLAVEVGDEDGHQRPKNLLSCSTRLKLPLRYTMNFYLVDSWMYIPNKIQLK